MPATFDPVKWLRDVVDDEAAKTTAPLVVVTPSPSCFPHVFSVDGVHRRVTCTKCKREFLAFDALSEVVRSWQTYAANRVALQADVRRLEVLREELRRQVQNLKGMARRAELKKARPRGPQGAA